MSSCPNLPGYGYNYSGVVFDDGNKLGYTQTDSGTIVNLKGERITRPFRTK
jgi:hypothetical protein